MPFCNFLFRRPPRICVQHLIFLTVRRVGWCTKTESVTPHRMKHFHEAAWEKKIYRINSRRDPVHLEFLHMSYLKAYRSNPPTDVPVFILTCYMQTNTAWINKKQPIKKTAITSLDCCAIESKNPKSPGNPRSSPGGRRPPIWGTACPPRRSSRCSSPPSRGPPGWSWGSWSPAATPAEKRQDGEVPGDYISHEPLGW